MLYLHFIISLYYLLWKMLNSSETSEWWRHITGSFTSFLLILTSTGKGSKHSSMIPLHICKRKVTKMSKLRDRYEDSWCNWTQNSDLHTHVPQSLTSLPFPNMFKKHAMKKEIIKTLPKLTFHVQVMKDRSIRIQHFIINEENKRMEHSPRFCLLMVWGFFMYIILFFQIYRSN